MTAVEPGPGTTTFCDRCGAPAGEGDHARCARERELEPPRFCPECARRMVVQVDPFGWTARCSRHGTCSSAAVER